MSRYKKNLSFTEGFTLIEFIVIVSIFAIIASIVLINFSGFTNTIGHSNTVHDIALVIRQAQVTGQSGVGNSDLQDVEPEGRGVLFETGSDEIVRFIDTNGNGEYDSNDVITETLTVNDTVNNGAVITELCIMDGSYDCGQGELAIIFERPKLEPIIWSTNHRMPAGQSSALITVTSADEQLEKTIEISSTGHITVQ